MMIKTMNFTGKEDEEGGYPNQEMVIYGSSRSSPRSHSAVGGNFDPQVIIKINYYDLE